MLMETKRWCITLNMTVKDYSTMAKMGWSPEDIWKASTKTGWDLVLSAFAATAGNVTIGSGVRIRGTVTQSHIEVCDGIAQRVQFWIRGVMDPQTQNWSMYEPALNKLILDLQKRFPESEVEVDVTDSTIMTYVEKRRTA